MFLDGLVTLSKRTRIQLLKLVIKDLSQQQHNLKKTGETDYVLSYKLCYLLALYEFMRTGRNKHHMGIPSNRSYYWKNSFIGLNKDRLLTSTNGCDSRFVIKVPLRSPVLVEDTESVRYQLLNLGLNFLGCRDLFRFYLSKDRRVPSKYKEGDQDDVFTTIQTFMEQNRLILFSRLPVFDFDGKILFVAGPMEYWLLVSLSRYFTWVRVDANLNPVFIQSGIGNNSLEISYTDYTVRLSDITDMEEVRVVRDNLQKVISELRVKSPEHWELTEIEPGLYRFFN